MRSPLPTIGDEVRRRLTARFGDGVGPWFEELPAVLGVLAERWQIDFGPLIPRGSMSVVIGCQTADGRPAVLKISPNRSRLANEASALESWATVHTPTVLAVEARVHCFSRRSNRESHSPSPRLTPGWRLSPSS
jgi:streptomycin 6-kinase